MTKLKKRKNKKRKGKGLVDIRSSFGVGPQEIPSPTTNLPNVTQSECLPSDPPSDPGVDPHDRSLANVIECDEHRFPNTQVISWNMNGVQNFNKLRTLRKMAGSCQSLFILIQESHANSECNLDLIRNQLRKYIWHQFLIKNQQKHGQRHGIQKHKLNPYLALHHKVSHRVISLVFA